MNEFEREGKKKRGNDVHKYRQRNNQQFLFFIYMKAEIQEIQHKQKYWIRMRKMKSIDTKIRVDISKYISIIYLLLNQESDLE